MAEKKHTPGPWEAKKSGDLVWVESPVHTVCFFFRERPTEISMDAEANARLIAAAPVFADALRSVQGYLLNAKIDLETETPKRTTIQTLEGGLRLVRAALASSPPLAAAESEGLVQATVQGNGSVTLPVCQWQPIETAPKDGTWVLGFRPTSFREDQIDTWQFVHRSCDPPIWINSADSNDEDEQPTHWMPLPPRPDDRTNGSEAQSGSLNQTLPASSVSATDAVEAERRLREALAPLAAFATFMDKDAPDEAYLPATVPHISLTLGQARAAATLLGFPHASDDPQFNGERLAAIRSRGTDEVENG